MSFVVSSKDSADSPRSPLFHSPFAFSPKRKERRDQLAKDVTALVAYRYAGHILDDQEVDEEAVVNLNQVMLSQKKKIVDAIKVDEYLLRNQQNVRSFVNVCKVAARAFTFGLSIALMVTILIILLPFPQAGASIGVGTAYGSHKILNALIDKVKDFEEAELEEEIENFHYALGGFESEQQYRDSLKELYGESVSLKGQIQEFEKALESEIKGVREKVSKHIWKATVNQMVDKVRLISDDEASAWIKAYQSIEHYADYMDCQADLLSLGTTENSVVPTANEVVQYLLNKPN